MPSILRGFVAFLWVMGALLTTLPLLAPFGAIAPAPEAPSTGERVISFCTGVGMFVTAALIHQGRSWVRHALMLAISALGLSAFLHPDFHDVPAWFVIFFSALIVSLGAWYFYFDRGVRRYFAQNSN